MKDCKLIFLDIDGTLINSEKEITPFTKKVIQEVVYKLDKTVVLISARMPKSLSHLCTQLNIPKNIVAFNGSIAHLAMLNDWTIQPKADLLIDHELIINSFETTKEFDDTSFNIYTKEEWYTNNTGRWTQREMNNTFVKADKIDLSSDNIKGYISGKQVHKVLIRSNPKNQQQISSRLRILEVDKNANFTDTRNKLAEITPLNISKGGIISQIAGITKISTSEMMAFGDADNDIEMLETVRFGFAMQGANERLKKVAYEVIGSNNENGVAYKLCEAFDLKI